MRISVIGSGFGGLAAAVRLAARGHDVTILEQRDQPGGRAYVYRQDGFAFDGGPTVITVPWLFEELFELAGRDPKECIDLVPVDPFYRIFFDDGVHFDYSGDQAQMEARIRALTGGESDVEGYRQFLRLSEKIFAKGFTELADRPFLHVTDMLKIAPDLIKLQSYRSVTGLVNRYVENPYLRQILTFHPLLVGGNPFQTTSIYALIHHLERKWGVWYAMGGTGAIVDALVKVFTDMGGTIRLDAEVAEIRVTGKRANGVILRDGEEIDADIVVCNGDVAAAYQKLLPAAARKKYTDRKLARMRYAMSLVVIYFGTDRTYRHEGESSLAHHNIILGPRYRELLDDIFNKQELAEDFSLYLHMPTLTDPAMAPAGCSGTDWASQAQPYRDRIMRFLEERYLPDLGKHIVTEHMIDPRHFETTLSSYLGSAFSVEPILTQSAWFRPHNKSEDMDGLYFVGAGTHPGAGLPGVLSSAKIADDLIAEEVANGPRVD